MSDAPNSEAAPALMAQIGVNVQYTKDFSFEVPGGPGIFTTLRAAPQVKIKIEVQTTRLEDGPDIYEVALVIRANATEQPTMGAAPGDKPRTVFIAELTYAGVFTLSGLLPEAIEGVLLVECPRLLFPYARSILSGITRDGGFPLMLQPMDFAALWMSRRTLEGIPAANALAA